MAAHMTEYYNIDQAYKDKMMNMMRIYYPHLSDNDLNRAIDYSINKRYKENKCTLYNNYKEQKTEVTLKAISDYIMKREPITTAWGVLFKKHGEVPNPLINMIKKFMDARKIHKKEMFKYPKYSEDWEKYNLLQLLDKIDCNSIYGVLGLFSSILYNLHVAASITAQGKSCVAAAGMCFEMFLNNNVLFGSLNEILTYIDNVLSEVNDRKYDDRVILDRAISLEECFIKIMLTCGFQWIPDEKDCEIVYTILSRLGQEDLNRLYYKNNLLEFVSNKVPMNAVKYILSSLTSPFLNPNEPPENIKVELEEFSNMLMEYVYYGYQIIDKVDRMENMVRKSVMILDTDSNIISLDGWLRFILENTKNDDYLVMHMRNQTIKIEETDEFGDIIPKKLITEFQPVRDFDFFSDECVEREFKQSLITPYIGPSTSFRISIINIMAYCLTRVINAYMNQYTIQTHSHEEGRGCLMIMKNEFLFSRILLTDAKKNYASIQEVQEGNYLGSVLDIKGLAIDKSSMNGKTRKALKNIIYEDILKSPEINPVQILKKMAMLEKDIWHSLESGQRDYYKPLTIKSISSYEDPLRIQGIKASLVWNHLRGDLDAIDLSERNNIEIVKVEINHKTIAKVQNSDPELYQKLVEIVGCDKKLTGVIKEFEPYKGEVTAIAVPIGTTIPKWLTLFINYVTIINDNLKNMPLTSLGIYNGGSDNINYTNIVKL